MSAEVFDNRSCTLGEGPLWHGGGLLGTGGAAERSPRLVALPSAQVRRQPQVRCVRVCRPVRGARQGGLEGVGRGAQVDGLVKEGIRVDFAIQGCILQCSTLLGCAILRRV